MYATWSCPAPRGGRTEEMVLGFDEARDHRLLVLPPLFDEANKFRHQIAEIMRRLDARGVDCLCPDLPGCNESLALHREQTLADWRRAAEAAAEHFRTPRVLAIRSGCWLVPPGLTGWLYAPVGPQQILRGLLRARAIAAREAGREESTAALLERGRSEGLDLAGWSLGPALVAELERAEFNPNAGQTVIEQAEVGGKPLWLRAENDEDPEQADAIAAIVAAGMLEA